MEGTGFVEIFQCRYSSFSRNLGGLWWSVRANSRASRPNRKIPTGSASNRSSDGG
jgi:hypothetical protein